MNLPIPNISVPPGEKKIRHPVSVKKTLYSLIENLFFQRTFTGFQTHQVFAQKDESGIDSPCSKKNPTVCVRL